MNLLCWNYRGTAAKGFVGLVKDMKREYAASFIAFLEIHTSGTKAKRIARRMGFDKQFIKDARGQAGGICLLWDSNHWDITILRDSNQIVHVEVKVLNNSSWFLTIVYGTPHYTQRQTLWDEIQDIHNEIDGSQSPIKITESFVQSISSNINYCWRYRVLMVYRSLFLNQDRVLLRYLNLRTLLPVGSSYASFSLLGTFNLLSSSFSKRSTFLFQIVLRNVPRAHIEFILNRSFCFFNNLDRFMCHLLFLLSVGSTTFHGPSNKACL